MPLISKAVSVGAVTPVKLASGLFGIPGEPVECQAVSTSAWLAGGVNDVAPVYPVAANAVFTVKLASGDDLYALSAAGTITIDVLTTRN